MKKKLAIILALVLAVSLLAPAAALAGSADTYKVTFTLTGPNAEDNAVTVSDNSNFNYQTGSIRTLFGTWAAAAADRITTEFNNTGLRNMFDFFKAAAASTSTDDVWAAALAQVTINNADALAVLSNRDNETYTLAEDSPVVATYTSGSRTYTVTVTLTPDTVVSGGDDTGTTTQPEVIQNDTAKAQEVTDSNGNTTGYTIEVIGDKTEATVPVETKVADDIVYDIDIPDGKVCVVTIPLDNAGPNTVVKLIKADGTEEILPITAFTSDSVKLVLDDDVKIKIEEGTGAPASVPATEWYKPAMDFMYSHEIIDDEIPADKVMPTADCDRETFVTFLYNLFREPAADGSATGFLDVLPGQFFSDAIAWAREVGIIKGTSDTTFDGTEPITREQIITILWRMAGQPAAEAIDTGAHYWAADAMSWAVSIGLIKGNGDGTGYRPEDVATVAEASQLVMNFINGLYAGVSN